MRSDAFIGSFDLNLASVYESPDHAILHKWLLLGEPEDPQAGSKGYLKVAIVILGPGDEAPASLLSKLRMSIGFWLDVLEVPVFTLYMHNNEWLLYRWNAVMLLPIIVKPLVLIIYDGISFGTTG